MLHKVLLILAIAVSFVPEGGAAPTTFLVFGGGSTRDNNEIALEKNLLYFQRVLRGLGFDPAAAAAFFANGNDGTASVRYLDAEKNERFKAPQIPFLKGAATLTNFHNWVRSHNKVANLFFYFTGHGNLNKRDRENNTIGLWNEGSLSVRQFAQTLDRLPPRSTVTVMMAQCYAGGFANFIYEGGDPKRPLSPQNRCGFFATIKSQPSVGCTAEVDESDYRDYSSSFFAGLSGRDRLGNPVASADYNRDGRVSYAEAHAFAKIDNISTDLPIATSESWLQQQASAQNRYNIFKQPIAKLLQTARPEQRFVVTSLLQQFKMDVNASVLRNQEQYALNPHSVGTAVSRALFTRLQLAVMDIGMERQLREFGMKSAIATLDRLQQCEAGSWVK